jgi:hypothetical protein
MRGYRTTAHGAKPSFVPKPHVVMKQPPAHQPASPKIGFLQPERGTNHDRMYLRGRLALRAISNGGADKMANSYIIEIAI